MTYNEVGFRPLYKQFAVFKINETIEELLINDPNKDKADCVLTYGYIDHEAGFSLELLASGYTTENGPSFFAPNEDTRAVIRIGAVADEEFEILPDPHGQIFNHYIDQLQVMDVFTQNKDLEMLRADENLDGARHELAPDDLMVFFISKNIPAEVCWVRLEGIYKDSLIGTLLNQPAFFTNCHKGDLIRFLVDIDDEGNPVCIYETDDLVNPTEENTSSDTETDSEEDFANTTEENSDDDDVYSPEFILDLPQALYNYKEDDSQNNYLDVVLALTQAELFVPYVGYARTLTAAELESELNDYVDSEVVRFDKEANEVVFFDPDIVKIDDDDAPGESIALLPLFSSEEESSGYGESLYPIPTSIFDIITLLQNSDENVEHIILNPFSDEVVVPVELLYQLLES